MASELRAERKNWPRGSLSFRCASGARRKSGGAAACVWASALGVLAALANSSSAHGQCVAPAPAIVWTYPDASTPSVPPEASFWLVANTGVVTAEVDGVPLTPLGDGLVQRNQFRPEAPLGEGEHELVAVLHAHAPLDAAQAEVESELRIRFDVVADAVVTGDVAIGSVKVYPLASPGPLRPPDAEYDSACSEQALDLAWPCNDIVPQSEVRIGYRAEGATIAYLAQGQVLLPPGCPSYWLSGAPDEQDPTRFRVAPVQPTGVGDENVFAGTIELRDVAAPRPADKSSSAGCSLRFTGGSATGGSVQWGLTAFGALALVGCAVRRRSR